MHILDHKKIITLIFILSLFAISPTSGLNPSEHNDFVQGGEPERIIVVDLQKNETLKLWDYLLTFKLSKNILTITVSNQEKDYLSTFLIPARVLQDKPLLFFNPKNRQKIIYFKGFSKNRSEERYIIELKEEPLLLRKIELEKQLKIKEKEAELFRLQRNDSQKILALKNEILALKRTVQQKLKIYERKIRETQQKVVDNIANLLGKHRNFTSFTKVFNGIAISLPKKVVKDIEKLPYVKKVWKDERVKVLLTDSVPLINATELWDLGFTGKGIKIAIVDTGVDYTHPDLGGCFGAGCKVIGGWDIVNNDSDPMDDHGHGTHCAGIAAANGSLKGVAPGVSLLAYKVLTSEGSGYESWVIEGIERAVEDGADIISLSLGGPGNPDDPLSTAVDNAVAAGVVVTVAAGNYGTYESISSPGTSRKAITVGATDKSDSIAWFSSRGPVIWKDEVLLKPEVVAPGVDINSTILNGKYDAWSGTSMATPHVAGAAALLLEAHPDWKPEIIRSVLMSTSKDLGYDVWTQGAGRIDVIKAYNASIATYPQAINFGFINQTIISAELTIQNLKDYTISINLTAEKVIGYRYLGGNPETYDAASLNETSLEIPPGENATVLLTVNTSGLEGYFFGYISVTDGIYLYRIPFTFVKLSWLTVIVKDKIKLTPISIGIHNDDMTFREWKEQGIDFSGNNYTFSVLSGNYTIYVRGDNENHTLTYILIKQIEVQPGSKVTAILNLSDARPFTIHAESLDGRQIKLFELTWGFISNYSEKIINEFYQPTDSDGINESTIIYLKPHVSEYSEVIVYHDNSTNRNIRLDLGLNYSVKSYYSGIVEIFNVPGYNSTAGDYFLVNYSRWMTYPARFTYLGWGFLGNRTIYLSSKPDNKVDTDVVIRYYGVPSRDEFGWKDEFENLDEKEFEEVIHKIFREYYIAEEQYAMGWILHNINESAQTILDYSVNELGNYTYSFNYPAQESYAFINFFLWTHPCPRGGEWFCIEIVPGYILSVPLNRTYYAKGENPLPARFETNWSITNSMNINYLTHSDPDFQFLLDVIHEERSSSITPKAGDKLYVTFGAAPFEPTSVKVDMNTIKLAGHLLKGYLGNSWLSRATDALEEVGLTLVPTYEIWLNGNLNETGKLVKNGTIVLIPGIGSFREWWDYRALDYHIPADGTYLVNLTIPSNYPVWNLTQIKAKFTVPSADVQPPRLVKIEAKPYFEYNKNYTIEINVSDNSTIDAVNAWYRISANWISIQLTNKTPIRNTALFEGVINITDYKASKLDLKIYISDSSGNHINYTISPIAIPAKQPVITISTPQEVVKGEESYIKGNLTAHNLRFEVFLNDTFLDAYKSESREYTSKHDYPRGWYNVSFKIPCTLSYGDVNLSLKFYGTGIYLPAKNRTTIKIIEPTFYVKKVVPIHSEVLINATLAGALLTINKSDLNWSWSKVMEEKEFYFIPRNYGNYTITLQFTTPCEEVNVTRILFANVTKPPKFESITIKPDYPTLRDDITIVISTQSEANHFVKGNISNETWQKPLDLIWKGKTYYDKLTGEPYNLTSCKECWDASFNLSPGMYNLSLILEDKAHQKAYWSKNVFVYPLANITFVSKDHKGESANRNISIAVGFLDETYKTFQINGSKEITLPNFTYFEPERNISLHIWLTYPEGTSVVFVNSTLDKEMGTISEYYEGRLFSGGKILYAFYAFKPSWEYESSLLMAQFNLTDLMDYSKLIESEDFEGLEGGELPVGWSTGGDAGKWGVTDREAFSGNFSVNAYLTELGLSWLSKTINLNERAMISFWYLKLPGSGDFIFYINQTPYLKISSEDGTNWTRFGAILEPGTYILNWTWQMEPLFEGTKPGSVYIDNFSIRSWSFKVWSCEDWDFAVKNCKVPFKQAEIMEEKIIGDFILIKAKSNTEAFAFGINQYCGDGYCNPDIGETCETCPADCGPCPIPSQPSYYSSQQIICNYKIGLIVPKLVEFEEGGKSFEIVVKNAGNCSLENIKILYFLYPECRNCEVLVSPREKSLLGVGEEIKSLVTLSNFTEGEYILNFLVTSSKTSAENSTKILVRVKREGIEAKKLIDQVEEFIKKHKIADEECLRLLEEAKKAYNGGDYEKAIKLAKQALKLAEDIVEKAEEVQKVEVKKFPVILISIVLVLSILAFILLKYYKTLSKRKTPEYFTKVKLISSSPLTHKGKKVMLEGKLSLIRKGEKGRIWYWFEDETGRIPVFTYEILKEGNGRIFGEVGEVGGIAFIKLEKFERFS